jgi:hypothetical protein
VCHSYCPLADANCFPYHRACASGILILHAIAAAFLFLLPYKHISLILPIPHYLIERKEGRKEALICMRAATTGESVLRLICNAEIQ